MGPASPQTLTQPNKSLIPSESSQLTSPTSFPRSCAESCPQTRLSTASKECSHTLASMPSRELLTTCPFPQHSMESQTCRSFYTSLSPIPPDPRLLLTSFPKLPKTWLRVGPIHPPTVKIEM